MSRNFDEVKLGKRGLNITIQMPVCKWQFVAEGVDTKTPIELLRRDFNTAFQCFLDTDLYFQTKRKNMAKYHRLIEIFKSASCLLFRCSAILLFPTKKCFQKGLN